MKITLLLLILSEISLGSVLQRNGCEADNCARAVTGTDHGTATLAAHRLDCTSFMKATLNTKLHTTIKPTAIPSYASACSGTSRYSSACSCWGITAVSISTTSLSSTSSSPSSSSISSSIATTTSSSKTSSSSKSGSSSSSSSFSTSSSPTTTSSKTSSTSASSSSSSSSLSSSSSTSISSTTSSSSISSSSSSTVTSSTPTCTPGFILTGASENEFNPELVPFSINLTCTLLDVNNYTILLSGDDDPLFPIGAPLTGTTNTSTGIGLPGFGGGYVNIAIVAMDTSGNAIIQSFQLLFGDINMPVLVSDETGSPVSGVTVVANATVYPGISQVGITDANGIVTFTNLASTTIGITARTADNAIGVNGVAATIVTVPVQLVSFGAASNTSSFDVSNGTTGWTGGVNEQLTVSKRDTVLSVSTNGQYTIQSATDYPKVYPFTTMVYIKYKFQTDEVPGGYFGTQYNDYYVISIRDNTGGYATVTHSMNELGIGAFDADGNTDWYTLFLSTPLSTQWVGFDVGVSNIVDNLFDSQIIVDKIGDLTCETCGDCTTCPGNPLCQDICQNPPLQSCAYYISCSEAFLQCPPSDYPIAYGEKNCLKFQNNLSIFSAQGQSFLWATMHCLQLALVASTTCDSTCDTLGTAAFASHPQCYVQSGFCSLSIIDKLKVVWVVGFDIFAGPAMQQALQTAQGCGQQILNDAEAEIESLLSQAANDIVNAAAYLAQAAAMKVFKAFFQNFLYGGPQV